MADKVSEIDNVRKFGLESTTLAIVDLYAEWCGPCKALAPVLNELAENHDGRVRFAKINVDSAQHAAAEFGVRSIPTLVFLQDGREIGRITGMQPKQSLEHHIDHLRNRNTAPV